MKQINETLGWIIRVVAISSSVAAVAAGTAVAREAGEYGGGMMNNGWGMFGGWGFLWLLLLVGLIVLVVSAVSGSDQSQGGEQPDRAVAELRERYARGEISEEEFEDRRRTLRDTR
jgi:putative membrane protein